MSLDTLGERVSLLEQRVRANEDNIHLTSNKKLSKDNAYLTDKIQDLENWSRSSNLRFVKIPESSEGRDILGFMSQLIPQLLR